MAIHEHIHRFAGFAVRDLDPALDLVDPERTVYRIQATPSAQGSTCAGAAGCVGLLGAIILAGITLLVTGRLGLSLIVFLVLTLSIGAGPVVLGEFLVRVRRRRRCPYCDARLDRLGVHQCDRCGRDWRQASLKTSGKDSLIIQLEEKGAIGQALAQLVIKRHADQLPGLILVACSLFDEPNDYVEALALASSRLPSVRAIFLGEFIQTECEISWIDHGDVSPVLEAFPLLEHLQIRGCGHLTLSSLRHGGLKRLVLESGGLSAQVVREVVSAELPQLEHLEMWMGIEQYGGDASLQDLAPLFEEDRFPQLTHLGLRNCVFVDDAIPGLLAATWFERLRVLDLSLGALSDRGARLLADSPKLKQLDKLDIHHHYVSPVMVERLRASGVEVNAEDPQEPESVDDDDPPERYCAVTE